MTFIVAVKLKDSAALSADTLLAAYDTGSDIAVGTFLINKINTWPLGLFVGSGELNVILRMAKYLTEHTVIENLPGAILNEMAMRASEIGPHHQIDETKLIITHNTGKTIAMYLLSKRGIETIPENDILVFFPIDYEFSSECTEKINSLSEIIRTKINHLSNDGLRQLCIRRLAEIQYQSAKNNKSISPSFSVAFQTIGGINSIEVPLFPAEL